MHRNIPDTWRTIGILQLRHLAWRCRLDIKSYDRKLTVLEMKSSVMDFTQLSIHEDYLGRLSYIDFRSYGIE